jgi:hypothetical protein
LSSSEPGHGDGQNTVETAVMFRRPRRVVNLRGRATVFDALVSYSGADQRYCDADRTQISRVTTTFNPYREFANIRRLKKLGSRV